MNTMTLENLTLQQIVRFAHSADLDVAEFGARAARLIALAAKTWKDDDFEHLAMRTLDATLRKDLANPVMVAHLMAEF